MNIFFLFQKCGVLHGDVNTWNIMRSIPKGSKCSDSDVQWFYVIDFGMACTPLGEDVAPHTPIFEEFDLFRMLKAVLGHVETFRLLEKMFVVKENNPEWQEFLHNIDPREGPDELQPFDESIWEYARSRDRTVFKMWEKMSGDGVSSGTSTGDVI